MIVTYNLIIIAILSSKREGVENILSLLLLMLHRSLLSTGVLPPNIEGGGSNLLPNVFCLNKDVTV